MSVLDVGFFTPLCDLSWHPTEHMVAFASYGADTPFQVWQYVPSYMLEAIYSRDRSLLERAAQTASVSLVGNTVRTQGS